MFSLEVVVGGSLVGHRCRAAGTWTCLKSEAPDLEEELALTAKGSFGLPKTLMTLHQGMQDPDW